MSRAAAIVTAPGRRIVRRRLTAALGAMVALPLLPACASRGAPPDLPELPSLTGNGGRMRWSESVGVTGYGFVPAYHDGRIWTAATDGRITAFENDGTRVAAIETDLALGSGVATDGSALVVTGTEGQLIGLDSDGSERWVVDMGAEAASVPAVGSGMVVIRLSNSSVAAYDLADGSIRWLYTRRSAPLVLRQTSLIAMDPAAAYVGLPGGRIVALSLTNGASLWEAGVSLPRGSNEIERIADVVAKPILTGSSICAAAYQGRVTCLNRDSGRAVWSHNIKAGSGTDLDDSRIVVVDVDSRVVAFSRDGKELWKNEVLRGRQLGPPTLHDGRVWIGDANGIVHSLAADSGQILSRVATDGCQIFSAPVPVPAGSEPNVVVLTAGGTLAAVTG